MFISKIGLILALLIPFQEKQVSFVHDDLNIESNNGHFKIEWESENATSFILQEATTEDFEDAKIIYEGPDLATFLSGLRNGTYYYRVGTGENNWSETLKVVVEHQSLRLAYWLMGVGAIVFFMTVYVVVAGSRKVKTISESGDSDQ